MIKDKKKILIYVSFMLIMIALGASDSMRGIFAGTFENHFSLTKQGVSAIVTVSYIGNLVFILFGGRLSDKFDRKKVCIAIMLSWMAALTLYILTDNYYCLLAGMFVSMGASTLMNTMINILSPDFFGLSAGMIVNTLFFTQGIGTSLNQNVTGRYAEGYNGFKAVNLILIAFGLAGTLLMLTVKFPKSGNADEMSGDKAGDKDKDKKGVFGRILKSPAFYLLVFIFGFYFIAEHGIMNWWRMYLTEEVKLDSDKASLWLTVFFAGMTIGRLVFSPFVKKFGTKRSIVIFAGLSTLVYVPGMLLGEKTVALVGASGLLISIIYPTMVLLINEYFGRDIIATATGFVISAATVFDIAFNAAFGKILDGVGFAKGMIIFPVSMVIFYVLFLILSKIGGHNNAGKAVGSKA